VGNELLMDGVSGSGARLGLARRWLPRRASLVMTVSAVLITVTPRSVMPPAPPGGPGQMTAPVTSCDDPNPRLATVCHPIAGSSGVARSRDDAVVSFRDTPAGAAQMLARFDQVGSVWGLAFDEPTATLYAAAFHKRGLPFGPAGPGAIYAIDIASGAIRTFAVVPNAGPDTHSPGRLIETDPAGRNAVGKTSLGDIDIDPSNRVLYAANLYDKHIYGLRLDTGAPAFDIPYGGTGQPGEEDLRPFGLAVHGSTLLHGVVNTAESSRRTSDLEARVYASDLDGSRMRIAARFALDYPRGAFQLIANLPSGSPPEVSAAWLPWADGFQSLSKDPIPGWTFQLPAVYPQPMLTDIAVADDGAIWLGLRDREGDMTYDWWALTHAPVDLPLNEQGGVPLGDVLVGLPNATGWTVDPGSSQPNDGDTMAPENGYGGLAFLSYSVNVVESAWQEAPREVAAVKIPASGALWFSHPAGQRLRHEEICRPTEVVYWSPGQPFPGFASPKHNSLLVPIPSVGDVEPLCGQSAAPTPTATSPTATAPTPSPTASATVDPSSSPSPSATLRTPTVTATAEPSRIYLPVTLDAHCWRSSPALNVALVIDVSTSMRDASGTGGDKLGAAIDAASTLIDQLALVPDQPGVTDRVALAGFNSTAWLAVELTADRVALEAALRQIRTEMREGTRLDLAFAVAREALGPAGPLERSVAIVLTDGKPNLVPLAEDGTMETTVLRAATALKSTGSIVYTIGLGEDDAIDAALLRACASSAAHFLRAPDTATLVALYRAIGRDLVCAR
jgi:Mg-chelatase subunit ChlD